MNAAYKERVHAASRPNSKEPSWRAYADTLSILGVTSPETRQQFLNQGYSVSQVNAMENASLEFARLHMPEYLAALDKGVPNAMDVKEIKRLQVWTSGHSPYLARQLLARIPGNQQPEPRGAPALTRAELDVEVKQASGGRKELLELLRFGMDGPTEIRDATSMFLNETYLIDGPQVNFADGLRNGPKEYASFLAAIARQEGIYSSEHLWSPENVIAPMLARLTKKPADPKDLELHSQYAETIAEIALGRARVHEGHPRFLGDGLIATLNGRPAKAEILEAAARSRPGIATHLMLFLAFEYPEDRGIQLRLKDLYDTSPTHSEHITEFLIAAPDTKAFTQMRQTVLQNASETQRGASNKNPCPRAFRWLEGNFHTARPLRDARNLFGF